MTRPLTVIGVDPGGRDTGLVVCRGDRYLAHAMASRSTLITTKTLVDVAYLDALYDALDACWDAAPLVDGLAVEGLHSPTPHAGMTKPGPIISAGAAAGATVGWARRRRLPVVVVPPGGNGSGPLMGYPKELIGARERTGKGRLRHCRSAWDVAQTSMLELRVRKQERTANRTSRRTA